MGIRTARATAVGAWGATLLLMAGCTSGPTASIAALDTEVMLAVGEAEAKVVTEENVTASQGDVVSTDAAGLAEVGFPDGSFMRLGPDSEVTITELGSAEAQRTSITLDIGQTWHNVEELVAEDPVYEVVTPVGVASVRGTVFSVTCVAGPSCTFLVFDGEIDVDGTRITPYQRLVLPEQPEPQILPADALGDWETSNIERDADAEDAVALPDPPLEAASLAGEWTVEAVITKATDVSAEVGRVSDPATWTVTTECTTGCTVDVTSSNDWTADGTVANGRMTFAREEEPVNCLDDVTREVVYPGGARLARVYDLTVGDAEWLGDVWTATAVSGESITKYTLLPEAAYGLTPCRSSNVDGSSLEWGFTSEFTLTRG